MAVGPVILLIILNTIIIFSLRHVKLKNVSTKTNEINKKNLILKNNYCNASTKPNYYQNNNENSQKKKKIYDEINSKQIKMKINSESIVLLNNICYKKCSKSLSPLSISMATLLPSSQNLSIKTTAPLALSNNSLNTTNYLSNTNIASIKMCENNKIYSDNKNNCLTINGNVIESNSKNVENNLNEKNETATDIMTLVLVVCLFISCNILVSLLFIIIYFIVLLNFI